VGGGGEIRVVLGLIVRFGVDGPNVISVDEGYIRDRDSWDDSMFVREAQAETVMQGYVVGGSHGRTVSGGIIDCRLLQRLTCVAAHYFTAPSLCRGLHVAPALAR
jgi:hypothetical protein